MKGLVSDPFAKTISEFKKAKEKGSSFVPHAVSGIFIPDAFMFEKVTEDNGAARCHGSFPE